MKVAELRRVAVLEASIEEANLSHKEGHPFYGLKDHKGWLTRYHPDNTPEDGEFLPREVVAIAIECGLSFDVHGCWGLSPYQMEFRDLQLSELPSYQLRKLFTTIVVNKFYHPGAWYFEMGGQASKVLEYLNDEGWGPENFYVVKWRKHLEELILKHFPGKTLKDLGLNFWKLTMQNVRDFCYLNKVVTIQRGGPGGVHDSLGDFWSTRTWYEDYPYMPENHSLYPYVMGCVARFEDRTKYQQPSEMPTPSRVGVLTPEGWLYRHQMGCEPQLITTLPTSIGIEGYSVSWYKNQAQGVSWSNTIQIQVRQFGEYTVLKSKKWMALVKGRHHVSTTSGRLRELFSTMEARTRRNDGILSFNDIRNDVKGTYGYCLSGTKQFLAERMPHLHRLIEGYESWADVPEEIMSVEWHLRNPKQTLGGYFG